MHKNLFDLTGRRILITGSNGGIGYSLALGLAEHGATAILNGRNAEKLHAAAELLREQGLSGIGIPSRKTQARHSGQLCSIRGKSGDGRSGGEP